MKKSANDAGNMFRFSRGAVRHASRKTNGKNTRRNVSKNTSFGLGTLSDRRCVLLVERAKVFGASLIVGAVFLVCWFVLFLVLARG